MLTPGTVSFSTKKELAGLDLQKQCPTVMGSSQVAKVCRPTMEIGWSYVRAGGGDIELGFCWSFFCWCRADSHVHDGAININPA